MAQGSMTGPIHPLPQHHHCVPDPLPIEREPLPRSVPFPLARLPPRGGCRVSSPTGNNPR